MFVILNRYELLQNKHYGIWMSLYESICEDEVDCRNCYFKRLVRSSGLTFERIVTAIDVLKWLTERYLLESTLYYVCVLKFILSLVFQLPVVRGASPSSK